MRKIIYSLLILTLIVLSGCNAKPSPTLPLVTVIPTQPPTTADNPTLQATATPTAIRPVSPTDTPTNSPVKPVKLGDVIKSDKPRNTAPESSDQDIQKLVSGNSEFAFDLYPKLINKDQNLFYSPYSISLALAMTYAGTRSHTAEQMAQTLHFTLTQDSLHPAFNALNLQLEKTAQEGLQLNIANSIWGQQDYPFLPEYLDLLAENYDAGMHLMDFKNSPEESRQTINDWVSKETNDKIKDLIPPDAINTLTRLVLANAIYFKAAWEFQFDENDTKDGSFHLLDGSQITVPMMYQTKRFGYSEGDGYQAIELPYKGGQDSMVILLPASGKFETFEKGLNADQVNKILAALTEKNMALTLPKFKIESSANLVDPLKSLGMLDAFDSNNADFSGIDGTRNLYVSDILHKAFVSVDENGTEAAAATTVIIGVTAVETETLKVTVDRPFIFLIQDKTSGAILFIGRVIDPR